MIRFTRNDQVGELVPTIRAYLMEAKGNAEAGLKPARQQADLELSVELVEAMMTDPELGDAFAALTPGRKRSNVINLTSAKKAATRFARIEKFRGRIIAGKGANEL